MVGLIAFVVGFIVGAGLTWALNNGFGVGKWSDVTLGVLGVVIGWNVVVVLVGGHIAFLDVGRDDNVVVVVSWLPDIFGSLFVPVVEVLLALDG